jgi:hypothetical protein
MVACNISNIPGGNLLVTPACAAELVNAGIIKSSGTLGLYDLISGKDDALWAFLRKRGSA